MNNGNTRRQFIQRNLSAAMAAAAFPTLIPASVLGRNGKTAPSNDILIAACARPHQVEVEAADSHFDFLMTL